MKVVLNENALRIAVLIFSFVFCVSNRLKSHFHHFLFDFSVAERRSGGFGGGLRGGFMVAATLHQHRIPRALHFDCDSGMSEFPRVDHGMHLREIRQPEAVPSGELRSFAITKYN